FRNLSLGIGTGQDAHLLPTRTLALSRPKVQRTGGRGRLRRGLYAKDLASNTSRQLGAHGGVGFAYYYAGERFDRMSMEERMTVCNMSIEGGARCGYVKPDQTTVE